MHKRGAPEFPGLELFHMLDRGTHVLCSKMVYEPDEEAGAARRPCSYHLAMPWMQLVLGGGTQHLPLLVWQGGEPQVDSWPATPFVWSDLFEAPGNLSPSMQLNGLPRRSVSTLRDDGPKHIVLLWETSLHEALR
jgi:hypothetical protein